MPTNLLRRRDVEERTGMSRSTLYRQIQEGTFPAPLKLGPQAVAWREDEVEAWIDGLPRADAPEVQETG